MPHFWIHTFGCQMNVHDSDRMRERLIAAGYDAAQTPQSADLIVMNTCSVREKAEHKLLSALGRLKALKEHNPDLIVAVTGCVAQQEGDRLLVRAPVLDLVVGPDNLASLPSLVEAVRAGGYSQVKTVFDTDAPVFIEANPDPKEIPVSTFVTVMKGCDERCTFCIVPYTRGPERYRSAESIVSDIRMWVKHGVREITLLGQTVNSWHQGPDAGRSQFAELLRRISEEVPELLRLRYTSPHPRHLSTALIAAHRDLRVLPRHLHLPVQSGSNAVLKRMLRRYTREEYLARIKLLKAQVPGISIASDIIVGFPGESESDFQDTLSLVQEADFSAAFAFMYSPRPHTPALKLKGEISEDIKQDRLNRLLCLLNAQQRRHLDMQIGKTVQVLLERPNTSQAGSWTGRSERNEIVHVEGANGVVPGALVEARVEAANGHSLHARFGAIIGDLPVGISAPTPKKGLPLLHSRSLLGNALTGAT